MQVFNYFNKQRNGASTYYLFKRRNKELMSQLFDESGGRHGIRMFGDAMNYLSNPPQFYDERLKLLK